MADRIAVADVRPAAEQARVGAKPMPTITAELKACCETAGTGTHYLLPAIAATYGSTHLTTNQVVRMCGGLMMDRISNSGKVHDVLKGLEPTLDAESGKQIGLIVALFDECAEAKKRSSDNSSTKDTTLEGSMTLAKYNAVQAQYFVRHTYQPSKEQFGSRTVFAQYELCAGQWPNGVHYPSSRCITADKPDKLKSANDVRGDEVEFKGNSSLLIDQILAKHLTVCMVNVDVRCATGVDSGGHGKERGIVYWCNYDSHFKLVRALAPARRLEFELCKALVASMEEEWEECVNREEGPLSLAHCTVGMLIRVRSTILTLGAGKGGSGVQL